MKIVIITGTAPPEPLTASRINWDVANRLAEENNQVWLVSPKPSRPLGVKYQISPGINVHQISDNFCHIYIDSFTYPKYNLFLRAYESLDFGIKSIKYVNRNIKDYDLIYDSSWPFFSQLMIVILRKNKNVSLIMNIQDLYPESFLTKIKSKFLSKIFHPLYLIDKVIAQKSSHITVLSESLKQIYIKKRKISESKISVIHNWQDQEEFINTFVSKDEIIKKYSINGTQDKFIFMYLGNIGPIAGVDKIITSFSKLNNDKLYMIIAGSGTAKDKCRLLAQKLKIANIAFVEVQPDLKHVVELQSLSDILLLPINPEAANSSVPSKLISYMFSGKPIITSANAESETALVIKSSGCGWLTGTNSTDEWVNIMDLAHNTNETIRNAMGKSGFDYAIKNYSKNEGLKRVSQLIYNFKIN
jgi:glycosyltransferase involved in cell wall biosynthesis